MAFDTLHLIRKSKRLSDHEVQILAVLLDFGACANAALDDKVCRPDEYQSILRELELAGLGTLVNEYVRQLRELERKRPSPGGDPQHFREVQRYRESGARLALGIIAATVFGVHDIDQAIEATYRDRELRTLFHIVMQCQIIDDVLDYSKDLSADLPGFLTATASLTQSIELTDRASRLYSNDSDLLRSEDGFALRLALSGISAAARFVISLGRWRNRILPKTTHAMSAITK